MHRFLWALSFVACVAERSPPEQVELTGLSDHGAARVVTLDALGRSLTLELQRNTDLFPADYAEVHLVDGVAVDTDPSTWANALDCLWTGVVRDPEGPDGVVALRTCDAGGDGRLSGLIDVDGATWTLRPEGGHHVLEPVPPHLFDDLEGLSSAQAVPRTVGQRPPPGDPAWVELMTVSDAPHSARFTTRFDNAFDMATLINAVDMRFASGSFDQPVGIVLSRQVIFEGTDPFSPSMVGSEVDITDLLAQLESWWQAAPRSLADVDAVHLVSGRDFVGSTVGYANIDTLCADDFAGQSMDRGGTAYVADTIAHELGHNFGMVHDGAANGCPSSGFLMSGSSSVSQAGTRGWSSCSILEADAALAALGTPTCLDDPPPGPGRCGDGVVDLGEACDCGLDDCSSIDPCCDGTTCALQPGASCSALEPCCDATCGIAPVDTPCRDALDPECDTLEVCDGLDSRCPADLVEPTGEPCGVDGACFLGACADLHQQCEAFDLSGNDWEMTPTCATIIGLQGVCDRLFCAEVGGSGSCFSDTVTLIDDGTPCGLDSQCFFGVCTPTTDLPGYDACPGDPLKTTPGFCGCGVPDDDDDNDAVLDCLEPTPQLESIVGSAGSRVTFEIDNAPPNERVFLVLGNDGGTLTVPGCPAAVTELSDVMVLDNPRADADGRATVRVRAPLAAAGERRLLYVIHVASCQVSDGVSYTF